MLTDPSSTDPIPIATNRGGSRQRLDRAVPERTEFVLLLPSDLRLIEAAIGYLIARFRRNGFDGSRLTLNLRVSIAEALANAMLYGNCHDSGKYVRVHVMIDSAHAAITVADEGGGFNPAAVPDPTLPENLNRSGGRGIFLIHQLMDEVEFSDRGNSVRFVLRRRTPQSRRGAGQ